MIGVAVVVLSTALVLTYRDQFPTQVESTNKGNQTATISKLRTEVSHRDKRIASLLENIQQLQNSNAGHCNTIPISSPSGYYWVTAANGSLVRVYCDTTKTCRPETAGITCTAIHSDPTKSQTNLILWWQLQRINPHQLNFI